MGKIEIPVLEMMFDQMSSYVAIAGSFPLFLPNKVYNMKALKLTLAAVMLAVSTVAVKAQTADEIIQKHINAVGGTENWNKIKSVKMTGSLNAGGMEIGLTQTVLNDKGMRVDISAMGSTGYTIVTPKEGWMYMPFTGSDKVVSLPEDQFKEYKKRINVKSGQLVDKSLIVKSEYIGKDTLNNVACYKLKITDKDGNVQTYFIDASTYYIARAEAKITIQGEEHEDGINYSNFQKQTGGVVMPMTFGTSQGDLVYKTISINPAVDEKIFVAEKK
jgi:hypothetical protein